ncbi:hypothetical protein Goari_023157, partial [Gossypium aridum]|nr:hypothetical protein [Gossypium aridum]
SLPEKGLGYHRFLVFIDHPRVFASSVTYCQLLVKSIFNHYRLSSYLLLRATAEDKSQASDSVQMKPSQTLEVNEINCERDEPTLGDGKQQETSTEANGSQDTIMSDGEISTQAKSVKKVLVERTGNYGIPELERLYSRIMKGIFESRVGDDDDPKPSVLEFLLKFAEDDANFSSL